MTQVQITWQRTCEYVATVDTSELRKLVSRMPGGGERSAALVYVADLDRGIRTPNHDWRWLAYIISNTEAGREYLGAMADDNPEYLGGTGAPEITGIEPTV